MVVVLAACGGTAPHVVSVTAPPNASWTSADIETSITEESSHSSSSIVSSGDHDTGEVRLVVRNGGSSRSTAVEPKAFGVQMSDVQWASLAFEIAAAADWIGVSPDHGVTWVLYDPTTLEPCRVSGRARSKLDRKSCVTSK